MPARASASLTGAALMNCGRAPIAVRTFIRAVSCAQSRTAGQTPQGMQASAPCSGNGFSPSSRRARLQRATMRDAVLRIQTPDTYRAERAYVARVLFDEFLGIPAR